MSRCKTCIRRTPLCQTTRLSCRWPSGPVLQNAAERCGWSRCSLCPPALRRAVGQHLAKREKQLSSQPLSSPPRWMNLENRRLYLICVIHGHGERRVDAPGGLCVLLLFRSVSDENTYWQCYLFNEPWQQHEHSLSFPLCCSRESCGSCRCLALLPSPQTLALLKVGLARETSNLLCADWTSEKKTTVKQHVIKHYCTALVWGRASHPAHLLWSDLLVWWLLKALPALILPLSSFVVFSPPRLTFPLLPFCCACGGLLWKALDASEEWWGVIRGGVWTVDYGDWRRETAPRP